MEGRGIKLKGDSLKRSTKLIISRMGDKVQVMKGRGKGRDGAMGVQKHTHRLI